MRPVLEKGLQALSVQEVGSLLSHLQLDRFVTDFKEISVSSVCLFLFYFVSKSWL